MKSASNKPALSMPMRCCTDNGKLISGKVSIDRTNKKLFAGRPAEQLAGKQIHGIASHFEKQSCTKANNNVPQN